MAHQILQAGHEWWYVRVSIRLNAQCGVVHHSPTLHQCCNLATSLDELHYECLSGACYNGPERAGM